jgi:hypothetical protein
MTLVDFNIRDIVGEVLSRRFPIRRLTILICLAYEIEKHISHSAMNRSILRGVTLLETAAKFGRRLTLKELAAAAKLNSITAYRLVTSRSKRPHL